MLSTRPKVSLRSWTSLPHISSILGTALHDIGGLDSIVHPGDTVVIKPNLTADATPSSGGTTRPEVVEALISHLVACQPSRVLIAEGTARFGTQQDTAFLNWGWREMAARAGVDLYNLDAGPHTERTVDNGHYPGSLPFSDLVYDADVFVSVPCLKTHISADYTVALKNSYALVPQWKRSEIHRQYLLEEALADINTIRAPDLTIVDGWDGAEGVAGGVAFDRPAGARVVIVGQDTVAVDTVSRHVMSLTAPTRYLTWCCERSVGEGDTERIDIVGDGLAQCRHPFLSPCQEVELKMPALSLCDLGACSGCRSAAASAAHRFAHQKLPSKIRIIFGADDAGYRPDAYQGTTLIVGDCAVESAKGLDGLYVPGCPCQPTAIVDALEASGAVCLQCRDLARHIVDALPERVTRNLRAVAAGKEVFHGDGVVRGTAHLQLIVGDCSRRYVESVRERASQFSMDSERDIVWVEGCPPSDGDLKAATQAVLRAAGAATMP